MPWRKRGKEKRKEPQKIADTEIVDREGSSGATAQRGSPGQTGEKTPNIKPALKFPHSASQEVETRAHSLHTGRNHQWQSSRAGGTAQAWDPRAACGPQTPRPAPSTSSSGSWTMGRGGWGHPASLTPTPRAPLWGAPCEIPVTLLGGGKALGSPRKEAGRSQPQPGASAMASTALGKVPGWSPGMWVPQCSHPGRRG